MQLTLADLNELLGGRLRLGQMPPCDGETTLVGPVVTDSREVQPDEVFWGLIGSRFNGAHFVEEAFVRGAAGVVVSGRRIEPWAGRWSLEVDDSQAALWTLANWSRNQYAAPLVAVTGSVGKTTTKQMIGAVLGYRLAGVVAPKNFNNHVGVPLSLLGLERWHQYAVVELAASAPGEIARLARLARPRFGVITNIGQAHWGGFGDQAGVARAKAELLAELPEDGCAVLNGDDPWLRQIGERFSGRVVWFGRGAENDIAAVDVRSREGRLRFRVNGQAFDLPVWGRHHLSSALAAIAVGRLYDVDMDEMAAGLAQFEPVAMRCEVISAAAGATIVNDTYNSSPSAMRAALQLFDEIGAPGRRIVVAGDLGEMGAGAALWHRRLGEDVVQLAGADVLIACGQHAEEVVAAAREAGMPDGRAFACRQWDEALPLLGAEVRPGDVVLIKGARWLGMERIVEQMQSRQLAAA